LSRGSKKVNAPSFVMTRMWGVNPRFLCRKHLLGEHSEMHQEVGTLENHQYGRKIVEGHAKKKQVDTSLIKERHDKLAGEMEERGMNHDSPLEYEDRVDLGSINREKNLEDLQARCSECRKRINKLK